MACNTLTTKMDSFFHWNEKRYLTAYEWKLIGSYPMDYSFKSDSAAKYMIGMSVPPLMMHKISEQIYKQWFKLDGINAAS